MNDTHAEYIVELFLEQESRLQEIVSHVPYNISTKEIVLPLLSSIIVECGSLIDTIFREEFDHTIKPKDKCTIPDFAYYYESKYKLSQKKSILYLYPPSYLSPYFQWIDTNSNYVALKWWQNYNELKHSRIDKFDLSTLETAFNALCALHQTIAQIPSFIQPLLRHDMICYGGMSLEFVISELQRGPSQVTVLVESGLFATAVGQYIFPDLINDIRPHMFGNSKKLARNIGRN